MHALSCTGDPNRCHLVSDLVCKYLGLEQRFGVAARKAQAAGSSSGKRQLEQLPASQGLASEQGPASEGPKPRKIPAGVMEVPHQQQLEQELMRRRCPGYLKSISFLLLFIQHWCHNPPQQTRNGKFQLGKQAPACGTA